jgi:hypothetical protein
MPTNLELLFGNSAATPSGGEAVFAMDAKKPGSNEPYFNSGGNLNAGSNKEAMAILMVMAQQVQKGQITMEEGKGFRMGRNFMTAHGNPKMRSAAAEVMRSAVSAPDLSQMAFIGTKVTAAIQETSDKNGFARRIFQRGENSPNETPRLTVYGQRTQPTVGTVVRNAPSIVRQKYLYPLEVPISVTFLIDAIELAAGAADALDRAYMDGLVSITLGEDRMMYKGLQLAVGVANTPVTFTNFTPAVLGQIIGGPAGYGFPPANLLMAYDLLIEMMTTPANWGQNFFDPVTQFQIVQTGAIATVLGATIITDAFRDPQLQILRSGEVLAVAQPMYVGEFTDRGPVAAEAISGASVGQQGRGFNMFELFSTTVSNPKGINRGRRL